ncbi:MAG TPA: hypothetical protein VM029_22490 [Opitutaceae bacterium]|nr:hypothetical protein [Opitutaceae bacterium]
MNTLESPVPAPARPLWQRLLRSAAVVALALVLILLTGIATLAHVVAARATFEAFLSGNRDASYVAAGLIAAAVVLLPIVLVLVAERKGWLRWPVLAASALLTLPALGWLAWDEPGVRQPLTLDELSPPFPAAEKSFAVLMRYAKNSEEANAYSRVKLALPLWNAPAIRESAKWRDWVIKNRAPLEADWVTLAPQRAWLEELAAFDRLGDLTAAGFDAPIMQFQVWRTLSQRTAARATLLALDGERDAAVAALLPLLQTSRRLQISSRTLVRTMIAVVIEKMMMETASFVLELGPVAPVPLAQLDAALAHDNSAALARRLLLMEYAHFNPMLHTMKLGDQMQFTFSKSELVRQPLNALSALLFNPNATTNLYGVRVYELAALAEARELGKFSVRAKGFDDALRRQGGMKNLGGRLVLNMAVPAFDKVLESHWKSADLRSDLRKQIAAKSALAKL